MHLAHTRLFAIRAPSLGFEDEVNRLLTYFSLRSVRGPGDDSILKFPVQLDELGIVPGHLDRQVPVLFGFFLRGSQRIRRNQVDLKVEHLLVDKCPDKIHQPLDTDRN